MADRVEVAVIGAGVVGSAIALELARQGRDVALIDPDPPGAGASYGNAGTVADYAVRPVGTPDVLRNLPSLLFDAASPLAIRKAAILSLAPWLARFLMQSLPRAAERNAVALAGLLAGAGPMWRDLALSVGAGAQLRARGCLYVYRDAASVDSARAELAGRRALGVAVEVLGQAEFAALEPGWAAPAGGAAFFPGALSLSDPGRVTRAIAEAAVAEGAVIIPGRVAQLKPGVGGTTLSGAGLAVSARTVVIAAGAHSRALARMAGDPVPLDTERGYHLEFDGAEGRLTRPVCPVERGFYFCPMDGRLRVAGTVELGGLTAPPSPHRLAALERGARAIFPDLPAPSRSWMGFRPSIPDSLPVIGPSRGGSGVIHAFGHGHIGLTLAPVTARIVADLVAGRPPDRDIAPFRVTRF
jgi:D-amino-acid dehydrogenase